MSDGEDTITMTTRSKTRRRVWVPIVAVCAGASLVAGGWALAGVFQSPQQVAARSAAPPPSRVTAAVSEGRLDQTITMTGTVQRSRTATVELEGDSPMVVTRSLVSAGDTVRAGSQIAELNGSPVFVLSGRFPFYRALKAGDSGPDVKMLQEGLQSAGFGVGADGRLGFQTQEAIRVLYARSGYVAPAAAAAAKRETDKAHESQEPAGSSESTSGQKAPAVAEPHDPDVVVPLGAIISVKSLPATAALVPSVGAAPQGGARLTLASGDLTVVAQVSAATAQALRLGMQGHISAGAGATIELTVKRVGAPNREGVSNVVLTADTPLPDAMDGSDVVIAIALDPGVESSLIVPTIAVIVRGDSKVVRKKSPSGSFVEVPVTELATSMGRSAIVPTTKDSLKVGDEVRVN